MVRVTASTWSPRPTRSAGRSGSPASTPRSTRTSPAGNLAWSAAQPAVREGREHARTTPRASSPATAAASLRSSPTRAACAAGSTWRAPDGRPAVLVLDEPTTGLDPRARALMCIIVRQLVADGTDAAAHHPVPRRGRPARQPGRGHRPRPGHRRGHARRAQGDRRRRAAPDHPGRRDRRLRGREGAGAVLDKPITANGPSRLDRGAVIATDGWPPSGAVARRGRGRGQRDARGVAPRSTTCSFC